MFFLQLLEPKMLDEYSVGGNINWDIKKIKEVCLGAYRMFKI
jgi:hypothetical protein